MKKQYTIIAYTNDFGVINNEKTNKPQQWSGKRVIAQVSAFTDSGDPIQALTHVFKATPDFREVDIGSTGTLLFDESGKAVYFQCGKRNG